MVIPPSYTFTSAKPSLLRTYSLALCKSDTYSCFTFDQVFHHPFSDMPSYRDIHHLFLSWQITLQLYEGFRVTSLKVYLFCCCKYIPSAHLNTILFVHFGTLCIILPRKIERGVL